MDGTGPTRDLDDRAQIHDLVVAFYREIVFDDLLDPVFSETAEVDWSVHIPRLIDYWCRILLGETAYDGSLMGPHLHVHRMDPLRPEHFDRWYELWVETVDSRWSGPQADRAKRHARLMASTLSRRITGERWPRTPDDDDPSASALPTRAAPWTIRSQR